MDRPGNRSSAQHVRGNVALVGVAAGLVPGWPAHGLDIGLAQADEFADFIVALLSNRSGVVTGPVIDCDQDSQGCHD
jgi:2-polyprenyl-6-methoxyphenol hydroxylase-like FAD-dependent oxidoreductase